MNPNPLSFLRVPKIANKGEPCVGDASPLNFSSSFYNHIIYIWSFLSEDWHSHLHSLVKLIWLIAIDSL